jgi:putative GTP pyrophosphokinase
VSDSPEIRHIARSQLDKLGDRLKAEEAPSRDDLDTLSTYRRSLRIAFDDAVQTVRSAYDTAIGEPSFQQRVARREKRVESIVAKLRRGSIKLSQMQDIAGFRVTVDTITQQNGLLSTLTADASWRIYDRRIVASATGYRAVHLIRRLSEGPVEAQIRTRMQHEWAQLSEFFDEFEPGVKYGKEGPALEVLRSLSEQIRNVEDLQLESSHEHPEFSIQLSRLQDRMLRLIAELRDEIWERTR